MKASWKDTNELNEALGDNFDVAAGWADFNQKKEKKRPIPFWFWGTLSMIGLTLIVGLFYCQHKLSANHASVKVSSQLLLEEEPSTAVSYINIAANYSKEKQPSSVEGTKVISDRRSKVLKTLGGHTPITTTVLVSPKYAQSIIPLSTKNTFQKGNKKLQNHLLKDNMLAVKKTKQATTKLLSLKRNSIDYLPILLNPLVVVETKVVPTKHTQTIPITPDKKWALGLAYTYNRPERKINGADEEYQNLRQTGEQFLEQQQVSLSIAHSFNRTFFLSTGFTYGRYRSRLVEKIQTLQSPVTYDNVVVETQTQNNITNEVKGTAIGSQLSINQSTRYQLYQTLTIPVQLGVQLPLNRNWDVSLLSGVGLNVWQHSSGNTYASTLPNGEFTPINTLGYRSWGTVESISNVQLQRKITKQLNLNLGLQAKFDLTNRLQNNGGVSDKWKSYGLSIGISKTW